MSLKVKILYESLPLIFFYLVTKKNNNNNNKIGVTRRAPIVIDVMHMGFASNTRSDGTRGGWLNLLKKIMFFYLVL